MNLSKLKKPSILLALSILITSLSAQIGVSFDGTDDKIDCGNNSSIQITGTAITLEAWIYPTAWNTNAYDGNVICKEDNSGNNGYMLRVGAGGKLNFALGDGTKAWSEITTGVLLSLNTWQHIAGTFDGSMMRVFVNGVAVDSAKAGISIGNASNVNLFLGAHSSYTRFFKGIIDEVRIWNICRTTSQLYNSMGDEFCSVPKGLKAYYKFNQGKPGGANGSKKTVTDLTGNGNKGTLTNFALTGSTSNWVTGKTLNKSISYGNDKVIRCDYYYSQSGRFKWVQTGTYYDTIATVMECDSVLKVDLTIKKSSSITIKVHACESYTSPSGLYKWTQAGVYKDYLLNSVNCDSVVNVILTIGGSYDTIHVKTCNSFTSPDKKYVWTQTGWYNDTLVNFRGCDSVITFDITIWKPSYFYQKINECKFYVGPGAKKVYNKSGIFVDTLTNFHGCDSFITTDLKILQSSSNIQASACNTYKSPSKKYTWSKTGIYKDTINNYAGCDSVITIDLHVNLSTSWSYNVQSCTPLISPSGKYTWTTTGVYKDTVVNSSGCDSLLTANVTIVKINTVAVRNGHTLTAAQTTGTYRWLACDNNMAFVTGETNRDFTPTVDGKYAVEITDNGCKDTSICYTVNGLGTRMIIGSELVMHPNPANDRIHVKLSTPMQNVTVQICDILGQVEQVFYFENLAEADLLLVSHPGMHLVRIFDKNQFSVSKILYIE